MLSDIRNWLLFGAGAVLAAIACWWMWGRPPAEIARIRAENAALETRVAQRTAEVHRLAALAVSRDSARRAAEDRAARLEAASLAQSDQADAHGAAAAAALEAADSGRALAELRLQVTDLTGALASCRGANTAHHEAAAQCDSSTAARDTAAALQDSSVTEQSEQLGKNDAILARARPPGRWGLGPAWSLSSPSLKPVGGAVARRLGPLTLTAAVTREKARDPSGKLVEETRAYLVGMFWF